jgi:translation initiation factor 4E
MGPPSVPLNVVAPTPYVRSLLVHPSLIYHARTRMTRLPSLKQLSDRLHSSSVSGQTSTPSASPSLPVHGGTACKPSTPPILQVSTSTSQLGSQTPTSTQLNTSPFTASPSSRLRLPASAMLRGSSGNVPTIALLSNLLSSSTEGTHTPKMETASHGLFANPDPFASPLNSLKTPASMSRTPSKDGYIEGYKDMPSLAAIRNRVSYSRNSSISGPEPQDPKEASVKEEEAKVSPVQSVTSSEPSVISGKEHPLQHAW